MNFDQNLKKIAILNFDKSFKNAILRIISIFIKIIITLIAK
jgi:hypothetical protein